jgi:hypothetical protein
VQVVAEVVEVVVVVVVVIGTLMTMWAKRSMRMWERTWRRSSERLAQ